jgi:hypothetical protein
METPTRDSSSAASFGFFAQVVALPALEHMVCHRNETPEGVENQRAAGQNIPLAWEIAAESRAMAVQDSPTTLSPRWVPSHQSAGNPLN